MAAKFPIPRPTERQALANLGPRPVHSPVALYSDLATTHRRRDWEGFGLVGHMLLRAIAGKAGERG